MDKELLQGFGKLNMNDFNGTIDSSLDMNRTIDAPSNRKLIESIASETRRDYSLSQSDSRSKSPYSPYSITPSMELDEDMEMNDILNSLSSMSIKTDIDMSKSRSIRDKKSVEKIKKIIDSTSEYILDSVYKNIDREITFEEEIEMEIKLSEFENEIKNIVDDMEIRNNMINMYNFFRKLINIYILKKTEKVGTISGLSSFNKDDLVYLYSIINNKVYDLKICFNFNNNKKYSYDHKQYVDELTIDKSHFYFGSSPTTCVNPSFSKYKGSVYPIATTPIPTVNDIFELFIDEKMMTNIIFTGWGVFKIQRVPETSIKMSDFQTNEQINEFGGWLNRELSQMYNIIQNGKITISKQEMENYIRAVLNNIEIHTKLKMKFISWVDILN
jgi:hypothetical protein